MLSQSDSLGIRCNVEDGKDLRDVAIEFFTDLLKRNGRNEYDVIAVVGMLKNYQGSITVKPPVPCEGFDVCFKNNEVKRFGSDLKEMKVL